MVILLRKGKALGSGGHSATPMQLRWRPLEVPLDSPLDFIDGLYTVYGAGSSFLRPAILLLLTLSTGLQDVQQNAAQDSWCKGSGVVYRLCASLFFLHLVLAKELKNALHGIRTDYH